jgi:hypothetical protein
MLYYWFPTRLLLVQSLTPAALCQPRILWRVWPKADAVAFPVLNLVLNHNLNGTAIN